MVDFTSELLDQKTPLVSHPTTNILRENRLIVTRSLSSKCREMLQHRQWRIQGILTFTPN